MIEQVNLKVPNGTRGGWAIQTFKINRKEAARFNLGCLTRRNGHYETVSEGIYQRLVTPDQKIMMNTTPMELRTCNWIMREATGSILINGLGLGVILTFILKKKDVKEVWIIEKERAVIDLVGPTYETDKRIKIIHADAMTYVPPKGKRFNVVWHDIWPEFNEDNLVDMNKLHRRYGRLCDKQNSWGREILLQRRRQDRRRYW